MGPSPRIDLKPVLEILEHRSFPELSDALRGRVEPIVRHWGQDVRRVIPTSNALSLQQLRNDLPDILAQMADALGAASVAETRKLIAKAPDHGVARFAQDYDVRELVVEYLLLRRTCVEQAEAGLGRRMTTDEDIALNLAIDVVIQDGIAGFVQYQQGQIRAAVEAEAKYLAFLNHDLRNALNGITLLLEVLKRRLAGRPEFAEDADDIGAAQQSINDTVAGMQRMLDAERLRKTVRPEVGPVNLRSVAMDAVRQSAAQAGRNHVRVDVRVAADATAQTDRQWVTAVLTNLVGNAVKYSRDDVVTVAADPAPGDPGGEGGGAGWVISVSDHGPGIAPDHLGRVFEAFRRGATHGQEGVGLGLAIASQAAKRIGAELTVESRVGVGSTFRLHLPARGPS